MDLVVAFQLGLAGVCPSALAGGFLLDPAVDCLSVPVAAFL